MSHDQISDGADITRDSFKSMIPHIILMLLFYTVIVKLSGMLSSQIPHLPILSNILDNFQWARYIIRSGLKIIAGIIAIKIMGGGIKQYGLTLKSDKLYIIPAVSTGIILILIQTGFLLLPSIVSGRGFVMYGGNGMEKINSPLPYHFLNQLGRCFGIIAGVFILHGVVQTYLMDKINGSITIKSWNFHIACFIVTFIAFIQAFIPFRHSLTSGFLMVFLNVLLLRALLTFLCAYWYEKSRSLVAPSIANVIHTFWFVIVVFLYNRFGG